MWNIDYWLECKISVEKAFHAWSSEGCVISSEVLNKSILNLLFTQVTVPFLLSPSYLLFLHPYFLLFPLSSSSCPFSFSPSFSSHTCIIIFYPIMYLYFFLSFISSIHPVTLSFFFHSIFFNIDIHMSSYVGCVLQYSQWNNYTYLVYSNFNVRDENCNINLISQRAEVTG